MRQDLPVAIHTLKKQTHEDKILYMTDATWEITTLLTVWEVRVGRSRYKVVNMDIQSTRGHND